MGTIYVLGAGFSKTCGIATDVGMLDALNPTLKRSTTPGVAGRRTTIEYLRDQVFANQPRVGLELFMSTLSSLKFMSDYVSNDHNKRTNIFRDEEREMRGALRRYLTSRVSKVDWRAEGQPILDFVANVDWERDSVITFNYDLLLETAAKQLGLSIDRRINHLHGAVGERMWAWPTYIKFAYKTTKEPLAPRWKSAFNLLRDQASLDRIAFIGYSMPPSDLEAKSLFNYSDWYNYTTKPPAFHGGKRIPDAKCYGYEIIVVNPDRKVRRNFDFFRKRVSFRYKTLGEWLAAGMK